MIPAILAVGGRLIASTGIRSALRGAAASTLRASRGQTGIVAEGLKLLGQGLSKFAKANPLTQLFVGTLGLQTAGGIAKQSQLNAQVRQHSPGGW